MDPHNTSGSGPPQSALELHDASTLKMRPYNKFESLAMLQQPLDAARDHDNDAASSTAAPDYAPKPVALNLHFRRTRLVLIAAGMISLIVAGCVFFMIGVELTTFGKTSMNSAEKDAFVNRYNSYTGYVTTALGTPLSMFVTTTVSVVALQLMANHILTPEPNWKATFATLMATTAIGYLVSNGFNAMNVQARDMDITPVIAPGDLTAADFINASYYSMTSNITYSVPEASKGNPTTNTILRNLVLPRVFKAPLKCTISSNSTLILQDDAVLYGISQRDWMKAMLTQAVDAKTLQVIINPTNANANAKVKPQDMPMNASRAAFLVLNTMFLSSQFVPWGQNASWEDDDDLLTGYQTDATNPKINVSTAIIAGLLPRDTAATEETKRKWLLNSTGPVLTDRFQETTATVLTDIPMNMTQIKLSESITFDSLSFEIDVDPAKLTSVTVAANKTRYLNIRSTQCGPFPGHCLIAKRDQPPLKPVMPAELLYDAPAQIHAFSICLDENGTEALQSTVRLGKKLDDLNVNSCPSTADGSMLLVSVAKRLVADALLENMTATPAGLTASANSSVVVNLRKIYTFTVARLGWAMLNLSTEFGAVCRDPSSVACMGLTFDLDADDTGTEQKLVVGTKSLPVGYLTTPVYSAWASIARQRPITLVQTHEPLKEPATASLVDEAGDILLPHNIKQINWGDKGTRVTGDQCSMYTEDRLQLVLNNHMYMEQSLQATYTAGMFFLFQKAVVRDVLNATTSKVGNITTLKFDQNIELMSVWLSMPTNNALLTLSGCVAIALGVLVVLLWPRVMAKKQAADPFTDITTAHVIAQVMLNEDAFPPLLVQRRVVHAVGVDFEKKSDEEDVDKFVIGSVALQPHEDRATRTSMA